MTSEPLTDLYDLRGVRRSLSRHRVSNDNPHAEAGLKTLKYRPDWSGHFDATNDAIARCEIFFRWCNQEHHHNRATLVRTPDSGVGLVGYAARVYWSRCAWFGVRKLRFVCVH
jgi:putative transposase